MGDDRMCSTSRQCRSGRLGWMSDLRGTRSSLNGDPYGCRHHLPQAKAPWYRFWMADKFQWIDTLGGPHILAPAESLRGWRGADGWQDNEPDDPSDYSRACRTGDRWLNLISSQD